MSKPKRKPTGKRIESCSRCGSLVEVPDGATLRDARKRAGLTLRGLASKGGVSASYLCDVELNRRRVTSKLETLYGGLS